jgi:CheY-like chemotaxis protein
MPDSADATIAPLHPGPLALVVDADHAERLGISRMIRGLGYPTRSCRRGADALSFVQSHPRRVSVLIADLGMSGRDGGELVERVLNLDRTMRVILMADLQDPRSAELLGAYRHLPHLLKPIRLADLYGALMTLVGPLGPTLTPHSVTAPRQRTRRGRGRDSRRFPGSLDRDVRVPARANH